MRGRILVGMAALVGFLPAATLAQIDGQARPSNGVGQPPGIKSTWNPPPPPAPHTSGNSRGPGNHDRQPPSSHGMAPSTQDQFLAGPFTYAPRYGRFSGRQKHGGYVGGYLPLYPYVPFGYSVYEDPQTRSRDAQSERIEEGRLLLRVTPASALIYVDGFYAGSVSEASERGLWLEAGPHRVELRADGFDTETFDVRIAEGETVNYQRTLARTTAAPEPVRRAAAAPKAFYVIRGCYAGDTAPDAARLPAGCRAADVRVIPPVVSLVNK